MIFIEFNRHITETPSPPSIHHLFTETPKKKKKKEKLLYCEATEQLKLHPLRSPGTTYNLTHHVQTRWKINLENRLPSSSHVGQHCLPKMPTQNLIDWPMRVLNKSLIEMLTGDSLSIASEADDLVTILKQLSARDPKTSHTYIWVY
jgi:hypothetical protein